MQALFMYTDFLIPPAKVVDDDDNKLQNSNIYTLQPQNNITKNPKKNKNYPIPFYS